MSETMTEQPINEVAVKRAPTVYFIDDSATMREVIKIAFRRESINVITCPDAATALAQFEQNRPDVVITDVIMPDQDGYSVCSQIKQHPEFGGVPVVLMSGVVNKSVADKAVAVRADELMRKPFQPQELIGRVKALLTPKDAARPAAPRMPSASSTQTLENMFAMPSAPSPAPNAGPSSLTFAPPSPQVLPPPVTPSPMAYVPAQNPIELAPVIAATPVVHNAVADTTIEPTSSEIEYDGPETLEEAHFEEARFDDTHSEELHSAPSHIEDSHTLPGLTAHQLDTLSELAAELDDLYPGTGSLPAPQSIHPAEPAWPKALVEAFSPLLTPAATPQPAAPVQSAPPQQTVTPLPSPAAPATQTQATVSPVTSSAPTASPEIAKLRAEIARLALQVKKLQTELQLEREYTQAVEQQIKDLLAS
jgi:twitching motility two-component system response regulator PilH